MAESVSRADADLQTRKLLGIGWLLVQRKPGPVRFSSGEAINLSNNPQLGLCDNALEERISCAHFAADLTSRIQRWVDGSLQAIRGRLEGRKELAVSKSVTDDQEIDVASDGVCGQQISHAVSRRRLAPAWRSGVGPIGDCREGPLCDTNFCASQSSGDGLREHECRCKSSDAMGCRYSPTQ